MAFEEYDDYEQEQLVKQWLKDNMLTIVLGIALGIGGLWGYGYWQNNKAQQQQAGAVEFQQINKVIDLGELSEAQSMLDSYQQQYGVNLFAIRGRMQLADQMLKNQQPEQAQAQYQQIIAGADDVTLQELARLRLARLLLADGKVEPAQQQLDLIKSTAYQSMVDEIRGDIYVNEGQADKAKDAYRLALNDGEGYSGRQIVEMKLADVSTIQ